jgi:hypothetical protein
MHLTKYSRHVKFEAVISSRIISEDLNNCIFRDLETEKYYFTPDLLKEMKNLSLR